MSPGKSSLRTKSALSRISGPAIASKHSYPAHTTLRGDTASNQTSRGVPCPSGAGNRVPRAPLDRIVWGRHPKAADGIPRFRFQNPPRKKESRQHSTKILNCFASLFCLVLFRTACKQLCSTTQASNLGSATREPTHFSPDGNPHELS
jgi:hypothetical protein